MIYIISYISKLVKGKSEKKRKKLLSGGRPLEKNGFDDKLSAEILT
jgi:hypothetical protein